MLPSFAQSDLFAGADRGTGLFAANKFPSLPGAGLELRSFGQPQTQPIATDLAPDPVAWNRWSPQPRPSQTWIGTAKLEDFANGGISLSGPKYSLPTWRAEAGVQSRNQMNGAGLGLPLNLETLPRFDARVSSAFTLPSITAAGPFRSPYRDMLGERRNASAVNSQYGSGSAIFSTSNLGNGMTLSTGSSYGSRSAIGGNSALAGQKHSGPSVGLKLTF